MEVVSTGQMDVEDEIFYPYCGICRVIKYLPLKLKGPTRHWLNSLPENSVGTWEYLEDAFRDNFQGTYVRPPDTDDLSHIVQQPGESAWKLWTRFFTKKNQIVDCPAPKP